MQQKNIWLIFYLFFLSNYLYAPPQVNDFDRSVSKGVFCCCVGLSLFCFWDIKNEDRATSNKKNMGIPAQPPQLQVMGKNKN